MQKLCDIHSAFVYTTHLFAQWILLKSQQKKHPHKSKMDNDSPVIPAWLALPELTSIIVDAGGLTKWRWLFCCGMAELASEIPVGCVVIT